MFPRVRFVPFILLSLCAPAWAGRDILAGEYLDRLRGMWLGQILGNYAGRATEGQFRIPGGNPAETIDWGSFLNTDPWIGDDDTCFEYMHAGLLGGNPRPSNADILSAWETHVPLPSFYIANRQARWLMADGFAPPETGSSRRNMHWYAIDSQITTESLGAIAPGMRQRAAGLAGQFGSVTNDGYAVHAAQFYAAMYAAAAVESDVAAVVAKGLEVVPPGSRTRRVVQDVLDWYAQDQADGAGDWRATHARLYDDYVGAGSGGRYRNWIESTVNVGLTTLALLYGGGDFKETVRIGVLGGFDSDCNPATAGGLIGLMRGYAGLPGDLTASASDAYHVATLQNIVTDTTISQVAADFQAAAEAQILAAGGTIDGAGSGRTYHLPGLDEVTPPPEIPDPPGPSGLVGAVLAAGGSVTVSASVERHNPGADRENLEAIIDGIVDVRHNGHLPYWTYDGENPQPAGGEFYQLNFDRDVTFFSVIFHEGDILWNGINANPRDVEPKGGYLITLTVEVGDDGVFAEVAGLELSEPLDPNEYFQRIELTFAPVVGDAVRIRGVAGGTAEFTSIVEREALGMFPAVAPGDANADGLVNVQDLAILATNWLSEPAGWEEGDFNADSAVNVQDLAILATHWAAAAGPAVAPEPAAAALLALVLTGPALRPFRRRTGGSSRPRS